MLINDRSWPPPPPPSVRINDVTTRFCHGDVIELRDEAGVGRLGFTLAYRDRAARVHTEIAGRTATARITLPGTGPTSPVELSSADELRALLLTLIVT